MSVENGGYFTPSDITVADVLVGNEVVTAELLSQVVSKINKLRTAGELEFIAEVSFEGPVFLGITYGSSHEFQVEVSFEDWERDIPCVTEVVMKKGDEELIGMEFWLEEDGLGTMMQFEFKDHLGQELNAGRVIGMINEFVGSICV